MIVLKWSVVLWGLTLATYGTVAERPLSDVSDSVDPPQIAPAFAVEESEIIPLQEVDESYRLPKTSYPTHYELRLRTEVHTGNRQFDGTVAIHLNVVEATNAIVVHRRSLTIQKANLAFIPTPEADPQQLNDPTWTYDANVEQLSFNSETLLNPGSYILTVEYNGRLSDSEDGFYISSYVNKDGVTKYLATTQFESTSARMAFPCYDEPGLKATFALWITHDVLYTANSNMPYTTTIDGDIRVTQFEVTPKMSTYLLAFVVSDFQRLGTLEHSVYARPNAIDEVVFAVEAGQKILEKLDAHLGIGYYDHMPQMKQFAIPDFAAGAMENWGLVTYREQYLLFNPELSTYRTKTNIATVIAHEYAHQWFGNLVSPEWWEYIWLNEGFATLYEYYATHLAYPEVGYWELFNTQVIQAAMVPDGLETTRPMTWNADTPRSIASLFDRVAYPKSGSVLNMMRNVLGEINWTAGLKAYLTARQFDGANADHLYVGLQSAIQGKNVLPEGVTVKAIMDTWANEKGYPVLSVRRTYETGDIIISQERFISDRKVPNTNVWMIPYNYVHQSKADFDDLSTFSWLSTKAARINTEVPANEWIIFNKQQVGYYRVNYDANNWELITNALINNLSSIDRLNRAQLIDDAYWLARSGRLDIEVLMKLLTYLKDETEYAPWTAANNVLSYFNGKLRGTPAYKDFTTMVDHLIKKVYKTLDVTAVSDTEPLLHKYLKQTISTWACLIGNEDCLKRTKEALQKEVTEGIPVHPDVATVVYCNGLRTADVAEYQYLYKRIYPTQNWAFRSMIISALGCSENKQFLKDFLQTAIGGSGSGVEINYKTAERTQIVQAVYSGGRAGVDALIEFLRDPNMLREFVAILDVNTLNSALSNIASRTNTQEELDMLNDLIVDLGTYITPQTAEAARATVQANFAWQQSAEAILTMNFVGDFVDSIEPEPTTTVSPDSTTVSPASSTTAGSTTVAGSSTTEDDGGAATIAVSVTLLIGAVAVALFN
ncbi:aminopeptidase N [Aedes aegypti]|uniref:Aminopeptidase n=1 Tax=Aedes aegypti TaxID=7159 RepID=A0A1S4FXH1_AEDAE|nr:aminopeptidase N [Aedes aegypti]